MNGPGYRPILLLPPAAKLCNRVRQKWINVQALRATWILCPPLRSLDGRFREGRVGDLGRTGTVDDQTEYGQLRSSRVALRRGHSPAMARHRRRRGRARSKPRQRRVMVGTPIIYVVIE